MSDWQPCSECGRYAREWVERGGVRWAVTAPHDTRVGEGDAWMCTLCTGQRSHSEPTTDDSNGKHPALI